MAANDTLFTRATVAFSRLTEREKRLVMLTGGVFVLFVVFLSATLVSRALDSRSKHIASLRDQIELLEAQRGTYQETVANEERNKKRIATNSTSLFALLQKSVSEVGLPLTDLNERRAPVKDAPDLTEVTVDLNLKEISVDKLSSLLEKIEGKRSDGVVKVTKLKVKTRFDNPEMLEANMTVATWKSSGAPPSTGTSAAPAAGTKP